MISRRRYKQIYLPNSSRTGFFLVTLSWFPLSLVSHADEVVTAAWSGWRKQVPSSGNSCIVVEHCPSPFPCFSCSSMISLVKSLSDRSRNRLQIPKSSPWNSLQSWKSQQNKGRNSEFFSTNRKTPRKYETHTPALPLKKGYLNAFKIPVFYLPWNSNIWQLLFVHLTGINKFLKRTSCKKAENHNMPLLSKTKRPVLGLQVLGRIPVWIKYNYAICADKIQSKPTSSSWYKEHLKKKKKIKVARNLGNKLFSHLFTWKLPVCLD